MPVIYEGSLAVHGSDYTDEDIDAEIDGLDDRITPLPLLRFTLDYPFDQPYRGTVVTDAGASLRQIIDAVRAGFRAMYRGATHEAIPKLQNQLVLGDYGRAVHAIEDLVIESIDLDEATGILEIGIGS